MNWYTKFEQDRYSRSKATSEIRFAQKTRWPPKNIFFVILKNITTLLAVLVSMLHSITSAPLGVNAHLI